MVTLTGFGDEISHELSEQLEVMVGLGFRHLELRGVWKKNVLDLTDEELGWVEEGLKAAGVRVSAIASPIGKVPVTEPFAPHQARFERALSVAKRFQAKYIRIFSYYIPQGENPADYRQEVLSRMEWKAKRAQEEGVILVHENERGIYGDTAERCLDLVKSVNSPHLRNLFDPANYVVDGEEAFPEAWEILAEHTEYLHIKDAKFAKDLTIVPPGEGDAQIPAVISAAKARGYQGFLSLEPHLSFAGGSGGFSGPDLWSKAARSLIQILDDAGLEWA